MRNGSVRRARLRSRTTDSTWYTTVVSSATEDSESEEAPQARWGRRSFVAFGAASAALAAGAWIGQNEAEEASPPPADLGERWAARLAEAHDPRDFGAYLDDESHPVGGTTDSTGSRGPYLSLADARSDFPWITSLTNEWDWVGLVAASEAAGEVRGVVRLPPGEGRIDGVWRPPDGISVFGSGVGTTVLHVVGSGSIALGGTDDGYRHGYFGDLTIEASQTTASPALAVGLLAESVCGPVRVTGASGDGAVIANAQNCEFWSWQVANSQGNGLVIDGGSMNLDFSNATVKGNGGSNIVIRRTDIEVPSQFTQVPRLIRFRGGLSEDIQNDGSACFDITAGIDITLDGVQTSVGDGKPASASVRIQREGSNPLQLIRLRAVQFKADDGVGLLVRGVDPTNPINAFVNEANFRTGATAIEADEGARVHVDEYVIGDDVGRFFARLGDAGGPDQILIGESPIVLPPSRGTPTLGAPRLTQISGHPAWEFGGSEDQGVSFVEFVPASWAGFDVEVWWTGGNGRGDVAWRVSYRAHGATPSLRALDDRPTAVEAAPSGPDLTTTTVATGLTGGGGMYTIRVSRLATDARDTLESSAVLYAVVLRHS